MSRHIDRKTVSTKVEKNKKKNKCKIIIKMLGRQVRYVFSYTLRNEVTALFIMYT